MINKILNFFISEPKSDLDIVLNYINKSEIKGTGDQNFFVGRYILQFSDDDKFCQFGVPGDKVPMFVFSDEQSISIIRQNLDEKAVAVS